MTFFFHVFVILSDKLYGNLSACSYLELNTEANTTWYNESKTNSRSNCSVSQSCVICIGSTGSGKSSTISKCTKRDDIPTGISLDRVTVNCRGYSMKEDKQKKDDVLESLKKIVWVDTVGWDDVDLDGTYLQFIYSAMI